jgi:tight adherence protein C
MATLTMVLGVALIFGALVIALGSMGGLTKEQTGVNRSIAVLEALTSAPQEMVDELEQPFTERVLQPLLARTQGLGRKLSPDDAAEAIREKLELAGNPAGWTVERVLAGKVVGFVGALILSLVFSFTVGLPFLPTLGVVIVAALAGYLAPNLYLYQRAYNRKEQLQHDLPDAIDLLTISVESGLGFDQAMQHVARSTEGPLAEEFARMLQEMQLGRSRASALRQLGERTNLPELRAFVSAMVQADAFGIPVGQVLRVQSSEIRVKRRQWAEEQAQKVPVKILIPLIFCILPCLFLAVLGPAAITIYENFSGRLG